MSEYGVGKDVKNIPGAKGSFERKAAGFGAVGALAVLAAVSFLGLGRDADEDPAVFDGYAVDTIPASEMTMDDFKQMGVDGPDKFLQRAYDESRVLLDMYNEGVESGSVQGKVLEGLVENSPHKSEFVHTVSGLVESALKDGRVTDEQFEQQLNKQLEHVSMMSKIHTSVDREFRRLQGKPDFSPQF